MWALKYERERDNFMITEKNESGGVNMGGWASQKGREEDSAGENVRHENKCHFSWGSAQPCMHHLL